MLEDGSSFDRLRFVKLEGESFASDGKLAEIVDRDYYQKGIQGECGITVVMVSRFDSEKLIGFYAPVYFQGQICGVMEQTTMDDMMEKLKETVAIEEDYKRLLGAMSRQAQMEAYHRGERELCKQIRQMGDDGELHWMEVRNILMTNVTGDLYSISMARCMKNTVNNTEE